MPWYGNRDGESLWYEDAGTGCPVVFLHGWCMSSAVWKYQFEDLATSMRLLAPDLRGHGRSRKISGGLGFDGFTKDLIDLLDDRDLPKIILIGWSMGAQIALQACAELTGRVAGMVLVSATPCFIASDDFPHGLAGNEAGGMRLKVQRNTQRALSGFYSRMFADGELENHPSASAIEQLLSSIEAPDKIDVLDALDALARTDMRHLLGTVTVPTLIVNGGQDRICLPRASDYLKEHIPDARQMVFPQCGHAPFLTRSDQFNSGITRFIRSVCE